MLRKIKVLFLDNARPICIGISVLGVFLFAYLLIIRNNMFFSGDQAMTGLMVKDVIAGKFYTWYFYGQYYYGNLFVYIQSLLSIFTGVNDYTLYFWEFFFYALSVLFGLLSFKKPKLWLVPIFSFILFFFGRHLGFAYSIQGFSFILFILIFFLWWFKSIIRDDKKIGWQVLFFTSFMSTVSLWHNPLYIIIFPVLVLVVSYKSFMEKSYTLNWKTFVTSFIGGVLGLVPLFLATLEKKYTNLDYFVGNSTKSYEANIAYHTRDLFYFFQNERLLSSENVKTFLKSILNNQIPDLQSYIPGLLILFALFGSVFIGLAYLKKDKAIVLNYIYITLISFLVITKSIPITEMPFFNLRYAFQNYFLVILTALEVCALSSSNFKFKGEFLETPLNLFTKLVTSALVVMALSMSLVQARNMYAFAGRDLQYNQILYQDLKKLGVKNLFCYDYYQVCISLAFWGKEDGLIVELIDEPNRNPSSVNKVQEAAQKGEKIYSLVQARDYRKSMPLVATYQQSPAAVMYYLISDDYRKSLYYASN
jgi:hypothetical protein